MKDQDFQDLGLGNDFGIFVAPNDLTMENALDSNLLMAVAPDVYGPRFDAIAELRKQDDGTGHKGQEFRRVASFVNLPLFEAMKTVLEPNFMRDKKRFYKWLDSGDNWRYCTYDRRGAAVRHAHFVRDFGHIGKEQPDAGQL